MNQKNTAVGLKLSRVVQEIHNEAKAVVKRYKRCQSDLIEILMRAEKHNVHIYLEYGSLYKYAIDGLELSDDVAYMYINLARKVREVPRLGVLIREEKIHVSKAKRISSVLSLKNQTYWLEMAQTLPKRQLERLVASENPRAATIEKATFVSRDRLNFQLGVSDKFMLKLRRAQDVLSQKKRRPVSSEEALNVAVGLLLDKEDPLVIAQRQMIKGKLNEKVSGDKIQDADRRSKGVDSRDPDVTARVKVSNPPLGPGPAQRAPIPASTKHRVQIKFQGQCGYVDQQGNKCDQSRFLEVHHIKPVSEGGTNEFNNLELLCSAHHKGKHMRPSQ